jgi:3-methyladenine DNA glycosylase AlkD
MRSWIWSNPERAAYEKRYQKSDSEFIGCGIPGVRKVAKELFPRFKAASPEVLWEAVNALWASPIWEVRSVAVSLLEKYVDRLGERDLPRLLEMVLDARNWAFCDWLGINVVGGIVQRHPSALEIIDAWSQHDDLWVRRVAMQSLLLDFRKGRVEQWPRFVAYSVPHLEATDFWTRKVIGWVLRETGRKNPDLVRAYLSEHRSRMAGLTIREAEKRLG